MTSSLARSLIILLIVFPGIRAQSNSQEASAKADEERKARDERGKKALALVEEIIKATQSLKLPENRIRIDIALAESLWSRDEMRARALFKDAVASLEELTASIEGGDDQSNLAHLPPQLRQEVLQTASAHDPKLALDFLRATRPANPPNDGQENLEAQLEMRLAVQAVAIDPAEALRIGEESLKKGVGQESLNLFYQLQSRDKSAAERFLADIVEQVRTEDFNKNPSSVYVPLTLLRTWVEANRSRSDQAAAAKMHSLPAANLNEQTARELTNILINVALNTGSAGVSAYRFNSGQAYGILQQLKQMMSEVERLLPGRISALRERMAEFDKFNEAQQGPWAKYQELIQSGAAEALMEASKTAPPEFANQLVQQAAWKAFHQGDLETSRQIAEKITDSGQRAEMMLNLDRQSIYRATEQQKVTEARGLIARIASAEEQARLLTQLASSVAEKGDKSSALQLLGEAQALAGYRALSYSQLGVQLQIADQYEELDWSNTAAIVSRVIDQLNELAAAALVLDGFDLQQYFRNGEFIINSGNQLNMIAQQSAQELGSLARNDFDGAKSMAELFRRQEMRVMALLQIAQAALAGDDRPAPAQARFSGMRLEPGNRMQLQTLVRPMTGSRTR